MEYGGGKLAVVGKRSGIEVGVVIDSPFGEGRAFFPMLPFESMDSFIQFAHICNKFIAENHTPVPDIFLEAFKEDSA